MEVMTLIKKAKKGDDGAFYELMQIHKIQLLKIAFSYLRNEEDSLEALQEVTFRAYRSIHKVKEAQYFSTWLIRIMLNYCHDQARRKKRIADGNGLLDNLSEISDPNQTLEIQEALEKIDSRCREVIILKYYHDLKITDIAEILQSPESTIKTWLYKGLKALRSQMEDRSGFHV